MDYLHKRSALGGTWIKEVFCRYIRVLLEFTQVHLARNSIAFFAFPGWKGMGAPKAVDLCLYPYVCGHSCCCSH